MPSRIIITPKSKSEIDQYYSIRFKELREPWGQPRGTEKDSTDSTSIHRMVLFNKQGVAVGRLQYNSKFQAQIRYMAVKKEYQSQGFGALLINDLENIARLNGSNEIVLQSRDNAVSFYINLNYQIVQKSHILFGEIQHFLMRKYL